MSVQKADDDYYITATYLLKLASKASILFESSEPEEKRLLLNMVVQNATLNGSIVDYDLKKPFDTILVSANSLSWLADRNLTINKYLSQSIKVFEDFKLMAEMRQEIDKLNDVVKVSEFAN